ncbi:hypothetical protein ABPG72_007364 [Tetrahymena utriculariae]
MQTRNKSYLGNTVDPKKGDRKQKSVSKSRSKSSKVTQAQEKIKTIKVKKSCKEILNTLTDDNILQPKKKQVTSNNNANNSMQEQGKKSLKRNCYVELPSQKQQKLKKTQDSTKDVITLTEQQLEQFRQQGEKKKAEIDKQICEQQEKEQNKHNVKKNNQKENKQKHDVISVSSDDNEISAISVSAEISISVYNQDKQDKETSLDAKTNQDQNMKKKRGRSGLSKKSTYVKKTYSSSQQKQKSSEKQEFKSQTERCMTTRSKKNAQYTELQSGNKKNVSKNSQVNSNKSNLQIESVEKIDTKKDKSHSQAVSEKPQRGRKPKQQVEKVDDKVQEKETGQQKTPKSRGRLKKQDDVILDRRHLSEKQQEQEYDKKYQKKSPSKESQKLSSARENTKFQALIQQQKPAKKEQRIEDKNFQIINVKPEKNFYDQAIEMLQEYSLPEEIPCRENEKQQILEFINEGLRNNGSSNCLYISGVPGIGKTASFLEVIKKLQKEKRDEFTFIHINGMNLSNPENLYQILVKTITGQTCTSKQKACQILNELFTRGKLPKRYKDYGDNIDNKNKVVLLDELDYLVTQDQDLLYNLMEWPHHKYSKLTIIGIANTMNLPEILMNKIKSRMGSRRLVFEQYNHKQIQEIVTTRLEKQEKVREVFDENAIQFACKKIAISSSDIRKTLKVLRKAVEICQLENFQNSDVKQVTISMIQKSYYELYSSPILYSMQKLQFHHKLIIISIALENRHRGIPIAYLSNSYSRYTSMLNSYGEKITINQNQMKMILNQLCILNLIQLKEKEIVKDTQLIGLDPNKKHYCHIADIQINSNFSVDDVTNSLKDDEIYIKFSNLF